MSSNPVGRPRKGEGPRVPYEELDRILVFGEVVPCEDGTGTTVVYPSYRELAERYGVSHSVVADYAKSRNVRNRRKEAQARIQAKAEHKLVELRSDAIAYSKDDELRIIDTYLAGFESALADKRVRFDNPADFNTMVRLKEFVMGNADSRSEVHASLSLESLQARHRAVIRVTETSPAERGEVERARLAEGTARHDESPPPPRFEEAAGKPTDGLPGRFGPDHDSDLADQAAGSRPAEARRAPTLGEAESEAESGRIGERGGDVGAAPRVPSNGSASSSSSSSPSSSSTSASQACGIVRGICGVSHQIRGVEEHHQHVTHAHEQEHAHTAGDTRSADDEDEG